ncbi:MAG: LCP family protein, partial [bacterium]
TEQYAEIDIEAGYQRLCGYKALQYVRYRHEDNDIVRSARQQTFLREARQKVPPGRLLEDREQLIEIFKQYTTSDIEDVATLVQLFKLMLQARGAQINQIEFPFESLGDDAGYVTAEAAPIKAAVAEFLGKGVPPVAAKEGSKDGGGKPSGDKPKGDKPKPKPETEPAPQPSADLIDSADSGLQYSTVLADSAGKEIKFPVLYPTRLAPGSAISDSDTREFRIDGPGDQIYHGYKFVITHPGSTYPTAYYGVSGTDWLDAPLFANPSDEKEIKGRTYKLYFDAGRLRMVAFQRAAAMYWVSNTLDKLLSNEQMLAIAQNLAVPGG